VAAGYWHRGASLLLLYAWPGLRDAAWDGVSHMRCEACCAPRRTVASDPMVPM
jgi:hypothetical protein